MRCITSEPVKTANCHIRRHGYVSGIVPHTSAARIRNVRRRYIGAFVVSVNGSSVFTSDSIVDALHTVVANDSTSLSIVFAPDRYIPVDERCPEPLLHLFVDQLQVVQDIQHGSPLPALMVDDLEILAIHSLNTTTHGTNDKQRLCRFTRRKLRRLSNWPDWQAAEFKQLDSMAKQDMYGSPVFPPLNATILRQDWNDAIKSDGTRKARNCYDGSPRAAPQLKLANTYLSSIEQPCMRMFFALGAQEGFVCLKVDATNAYANFPPRSSRHSFASTTSTLAVTRLVLVCPSNVPWFSARCSMRFKVMPNLVPCGRVLSIA